MKLLITRLIIIFINFSAFSRDIVFTNKQCQKIRSISTAVYERYIRETISLNSEMAEFYKKRTLENPTIYQAFCKD